MRVCVVDAHACTVREQFSGEKLDTAERVAWTSPPARIFEPFDSVAVVVFERLNY